MRECFDCHASIANKPGNYYCAECVAVQSAEYYGGRELAAFNAYHAWVDRVTR